MAALVQVVVAVSRWWVWCPGGGCGWQTSQVRIQVGRACGWQSLWLAEPVVGRPLRFGFRSTLVNAEPVVGRACGWLLTNFCRGSTLVNALHRGNRGTVGSKVIQLESNAEHLQSLMAWINCSWSGNCGTGIVEWGCGDGAAELDWFGSLLVGVKRIEVWP